MTAPAAAAARHAERVAEYYDRNTAPFYLERWHPEDIHFGLFPADANPRDHYTAVKRMTGAVVAPAAIRPDNAVVDAGCGVGGASLDVARATGASVLGVTISPFQVEHATRRAHDAGVAERVRFAHGDCSRELPCADASVDVVFTIEAACHFLDKPGFLRECRRVLRPGGRLVGSDWMAADGLDLAQARRSLDPVCESWRLAGMESPAAWRTMLGNAGFSVLELEDFGTEVLPNIAILARGRVDLLLEKANGCHPDETVALWHAQYGSLIRAWTSRHFTIGRFAAVARR